MTMEIKQHDLKPDLVINVFDGAQLADLTGVVSWRILGKLKGVLVVDSAPSSAAVIDPLTKWKATLTRAWVSGDTANPGDMRIEVEAMWPGSKPQTFPASSTETVRINPDLG